MWSLLIAAMVAGQAAPAEAGPAMFSRVRSLEPAIVAAIEEGARLSPTFRALLDTINGTDGLVYVEEGRCGRGVRGCTLHSVVLSGPHRLMRIKVETRKAGDELMALLGHELQHAIEVLRRPELRSNAAIVSFYQQEGTFSDGTAVETTAAVNAGMAVDAEVRQARAGAIGKGALH
jgi:hypothetical protein